MCPGKILKLGSCDFLLGLHVEAKRCPLGPELQFRKHLRGCLHGVFTLITALRQLFGLSALRCLKLHLVT